MIGVVLFYGAVVLFFLASMVLVLLNVWRAVKISKLEGEDKPDTTAWVLWGISVASLFMSSCVAILLWVTMEWILKPIDPFEDPLGCVQMQSYARSNVSFVIIRDIVLLALAFLMPVLSGSGSM